MRLKDIPKGNCVRRSNSLTYDDGLYIEVREDNTYWYIHPSGQKPQQLMKNSTSFDRNDFVIIGKLKTSRGTNKMKTEYKKATVAVVESTSNQAHTFETEDEALEHIADILESSPRSKFKMFKLYQVVEPKRPNLKDLIKKVL